MVPGLPGETSVFGGVFFVSKFLLEIKVKNLKMCSFVLRYHSFISSINQSINK